jgi:hypothetical protein
MSNVAINIAAEYTGKAAFKEAQKSVQTLEKTVKRFAGGLGLGLGLSAVTAFGKASVKAFAADEAAARRLAGAVDNLGLSFSQTKVTEFIDGLERSAAIADDVLRPSFQSLLTTTGSLTKSQELLNNAIQISRASGIDLATVSTDLGKGYVGITRGLVKYNTGLTRAEITTKSFNEILGIMLARSAGQAQDYLTTTSYKMEVLTTATGRAQETIGEGLVDAFAKIAGGSEASDAAQTIDTFAKGINTLTGFLGSAIGALVKFYKIRQDIARALPGGGKDGLIGNLFNNEPSTNRSKSPAGTAQRTAQQRTAEALAAKRAKELAALQAKQLKSQKALTAEQKKQAALKKAGTIFDLEQINLIAALKGKLSEEDKIRVQAQLALLNNNETAATSLTKKILMSQDATGALYKLWQTLPDARNPFEYLDEYLNGLARKAAALLAGQQVPAAVIPSNVAPSISTNATNAGGFAYSVADPSKGGSMDSQFGSNTPWAIAVAALNRPVVVQIDGKAIASSTQNESLSGVPAGVNRSNGMFGR